MPRPPILFSCLMVLTGIVLLANHSPIPKVNADEKPEKYALLVAVTKYKHTAMNKPQLEFPEVDATDLAKILRASGYTVDLLLGSNATQAAIQAKLSGLTRRGNDAGVVVIGLFGHGVEYEKDETAHFCPYDTEIREVKDSQDRLVYGKDQQPLIEPVPKSLVPMTDLLSGLRTCPAGNKAMLADCCRNTPNRPRGRAFGAKLQLKDVPENTAILFACSANEQAFEHRDWGHGAFSKVLLDELAAMSQDGSVTMGALADRIRPKVVQLVKGQDGRSLQTPRSFISDSVDLQLVRLNNKPSATPKPVPPATDFEGRTAGETREDNGLKMKLVWCPAGTFDMGSPDSDIEALADEKPQHQVRVNGFWMGQTEVTQGQFQSVHGTAPWSGGENVKEGADYAASYVSWDDAQEFVKKLTLQERSAGRLPAGAMYRLPTEAEWEYACRAETKTIYSFGDSDSRLSDYAWWGGILGDGNAKTEQYAHQVGLKKPNAWGLKDMHGNVWEWCEDMYNDKLYAQRNGITTDPLPTSGSKYRVLRGGSWNSRPRYTRSAYRFGFTPDGRDYCSGFRVVYDSGRRT